MRFLFGIILFNIFFKVTRFITSSIMKIIGFFSKQIFNNIKQLYKPKITNAHEDNRNILNKYLEQTVERDVQESVINCNTNRRKSRL